MVIMDTIIRLIVQGGNIVRAIHPLVETLFTCLQLIHSHIIIIFICLNFSLSRGSKNNRFSTHHAFLSSFNTLQLKFFPTTYVPPNNRTYSLHVLWNFSSSTCREKQSLMAFTFRKAGRRRLDEVDRISDNKCSLATALETDNHGEATAAGIMFTVLPVKAIDLLTLEFHAFDETSASTNPGVQVYYRKGSFSGVTNDPSQWTMLANTTARFSPDGTRAILPVNEFEPVPMEAGELYALYVAFEQESSVQVKLAEHLIGEVATSDEALQFLTGVSLDGQDLFPSSFSDAIDFMGAFHYRLIQDCEAARTTTDVVLEFAVNVDPEESVIGGLTEAVREAISALLLSNTDLARYAVNDLLELKDVNSGFQGRSDEKCPENFDSCSLVSSTVSLAHLPTLIPGILQMVILSEYEMLSEAVSTRVEAVPEYVGEPLIKGEYVVTLVGVPSDVSMNEIQRRYFERVTAEFLRGFSEEYQVKIFNVKVSDEVPDGKGSEADEVRRLVGILSRDRRPKQSFLRRSSVHRQLLDPGEGSIQVLIEIVAYADESNLRSAILESIGSNNEVYMSELAFQQLRPGEINVENYGAFFGGVTGVQVQLKSSEYGADGADDILGAINTDDTMDEGGSVWIVLCILGIVLPLLMLLYRVYKDCFYSPAEKISKLNNRDEEPERGFCNNGNLSEHDGWTESDETLAARHDEASSSEFSPVSTEGKLNSRNNLPRRSSTNDNWKPGSSPLLSLSTEADHQRTSQPRRRSLDTYLQCPVNKAAQNGRGVKPSKSLPKTLIEGRGPFSPDKGESIDCMEVEPTKARNVIFRGRPKPENPRVGQNKNQYIQDNHNDPEQPQIDMCNHPESFRKEVHESDIDSDCSVESDLPQIDGGPKDPNETSESACEFGEESEESDSSDDESNASKASQVYSCGTRERSSDQLDRQELERAQNSLKMIGYKGAKEIGLNSSDAARTDDGKPNKPLRRREIAHKEEEETKSLVHTFNAPTASDDESVESEMTLATGDDEASLSDMEYDESISKKNRNEEIEERNEAAGLEIVVRDYGIAPGQVTKIKKERIENDRRRGVATSMVPNKQLRHEHDESSSEESDLEAPTIQVGRAAVSSENKIPLAYKEKSKSGYCSDDNVTRKTPGGMKHTAIQCVSDDEVTSGTIARKKTNSQMFRSRRIPGKQCGALAARKCQATARAREIDYSSQESDSETHPGPKFVATKKNCREIQKVPKMSLANGMNGSVAAQLVNGANNSVHDRSSEDSKMKRSPAILRPIKKLSVHGGQLRNNETCGTTNPINLAPSRKTELGVSSIHIKKHQPRNRSGSNGRCLTPSKSLPTPFNQVSEAKAPIGTEAKPLIKVQMKKTSQTQTLKESKNKTVTRGCGLGLGESKSMPSSLVKKKKKLDRTPSVDSTSAISSEGSSVALGTVSGGDLDSKNVTSKAPKLDDPKTDECYSDKQPSRIPMKTVTGTNDEGSGVHSITAGSRAKKCMSAESKRLEFRAHLRNKTAQEPDISSSILMPSHLRETSEHSERPRSIKRSHSADHVYGKAGKIKFKAGGLSRSRHETNQDAPKHDDSNTVKSDPNLQLRLIPKKKHIYGTEKKEGNTDWWMQKRPIEVMPSTNRENE